MVTAISELIPLNSSRGRLIPQFVNGKTLNCSTLWRWVRKGLAGPNGERIKLEVIYVGRTPYVSAEMVKTFFDRITAAKLERVRPSDVAFTDVTEAELTAAGLINCR